MSGSLLWAVDVYGRVFSVSAARGRWKRTADVLLELKRVTGSQQCCWGIGFDHQVYLSVDPSDVPIHHQEETYENQRWNPVDGYTDTLLPTDCWQWTDESGLNNQPLQSFVLPSTNWEWDGDWYVDDESCGRESSETGGWEYSVDFPATFTKEKKWNSCVQHRRWLCYRSYKALGSWTKVPVDRGRPPPEPFIDISCGGWDLSDSPQKHIYLWSVSQQGKVWFRNDIQHQNPEGTCWEPVQVHREVAQVGAGPKDLLWVVLWDGQLLVRTGISKDCPKGSSWELVASPNQKGAVHVAVGINVVWAVTKDKKVWFRRGVNSHNPTGSGWINIGGEMMMLSVGPNDQVWWIGSDDRIMYFRQGVTATEVTGGSWVAVSAQLDGSVFTSHSRFGELTAASQGSVLSSDDMDIPEPHVLKITSDSLISALVSDRSALIKDSAVHPTVPEGDQVSSQESTPTLQSDSGNTPWSIVDLEELKGSVLSTGLSSVATYPFELEQNVVEQEKIPPWAWVSGGGCDIDSSSDVSWLHISDTGPLSPSIAPAVSAANTKRTQLEQERIVCVCQSVRVKRGRMCWWRDWLPHQWEDVCVTLEQVSSAGPIKDNILYLYYTHNHKKKYVHAMIKELTALVPVFRDALYTMALYTPEKTRQRHPILLATHSQQDFNTWLSLLNESCCESRGVGDHLSKQALWAVTSKGDIMVHEPLHSLETPAQYLPSDQMFWRQVPGHLLCVESNSLGVVWGIGHDHTAWVYTGGLQRRLRSGSLISGNENVNQAISDIRNVYIFENQRWNPMAGYTDKGLPTDRYIWSDSSGLKECTKESTIPPSPQWTWVSDWAVDYSVHGGTDKEGWQYAADFSVTFHGYKTLKDFVRCRRWARKCKINLTGPWQKVPPIPLNDITILPCLAQCSLEQVPLWAISDTCWCAGRFSNQSLKPQGNSWLHVGTDQPFKSICIGGGHQVWAIGRDGAVFYRGSVSAHNPAGECWYHIPSPPRQSLKRVSVGRTSVYAVDENSNLWHRQGLTPSYPQGSAWELISSNVCKVSVGPLDQVWIIADKVPGYPTESSGTVCHRLEVKPMQPKGLSWDFGIGGGWDYLSVRGNSIDAQRVAPRSPLPNLTQRQVNGKALGC
ncbi:LOW QUALITY PROTEIN: tectonin beta-propeller repeat-containing protein 1-like [Xyrauchen texanus]|uniref:LOW QUALITY PROTEIN: tectonin beta-propeller repeat-containing protein 1-like n=1 Tax=Xyrauchen texanus TaxID=154827 RepID=UPI002242C38D|nr:LOW QUALITY PROTEIN: tectonin beta-propeller repeat-containing protein 1-like [Xyrauchen texanus]